MPQFIFAYHGGKTPESPEEGEKVMAAWNDWFASMGEVVDIPGAPVGLSKTVSQSGVADNGGANPISGYTVISVDTIDEACSMAQECPMVRDGTGSVEVAEIHEM